jgi:hypothetical protein
MSSAFPSFTQFTPHARHCRAAPTRSLLSRVWHILLKAGQHRAAAEVARQVRRHGGRATGNIRLDAQHLAALRYKEPASLLPNSRT